jgi:hypothetical protein
MHFAPQKEVRRRLSLEPYRSQGKMEKNKKKDDVRKRKIFFQNGISFRPCTCKNY